MSLRDSRKTSTWPVGWRLVTVLWKHSFDFRSYCFVLIEQKVKRSHEMERKMSAFSKSVGCAMSKGFHNFTADGFTPKHRSFMPHLSLFVLLSLIL